MVLSSLIFLFAFLPAVLAVYYLCPRRSRNAVLAAAGLIFCAYGRPASLFPLAAAAAAAFLLARLCSRSRNPGWFVCGVLAVLLPLMCFKFLPAFRQSGLPQGISFYTFALLSYLADVRCGRAEAERNPARVVCFVTLLPLLGAGPILRWSDTQAQLTDRRESVAAFGAGTGRFCCGLGKKLLLGDALAGAFRYLQALQEYRPTVAGAWLTSVCYLLHLYFDFSGYTDMALGVGRMFGFRFPENFDYPFLARSITDFWRRWHLSLSRWFRDYVYIPLGGSRRGRLRQCRNLAAVWLLTGLWHGTGRNYLLWGAYFCVLLILEHLFLRRVLERLPAVLSCPLTLFAVLVGFLFFSASDGSAGFSCLGALFGLGTVGLSSPVLSWQFRRLLPLLALAAVGSTPLPRRLFGWMSCRVPVLLPLGSLALFALCVAYLLDSSFLPFAYLNF